MKRMLVAATITCAAFVASSGTAPEAAEIEQQEAMAPAAVETLDCSVFGYPRGVVGNRPNGETQQLYKGNKRLLYYYAPTDGTANIEHIGDVVGPSAGSIGEYSRVYSNPHQHDDATVWIMVAEPGRVVVNSTEKYCQIKHQNVTVAPNTRGELWRGDDNIFVVNEGPGTVTLQDVNGNDVAGKLPAGASVALGGMNQLYAKNVNNPAAVNATVYTFIGYDPIRIASIEAEIARITAANAETHRER
ncbi:MAG: hypothetical protein GKS06_07980 [Acidobacteria bacterium]|nr:hypothetical protein [Acidobacteriota bacterium]